MNYVQRAREVLDVEIQGLLKVQRDLDGGFTRAIECLIEGLGQGGKIVVTGIGKNLHIAEKISATLASTGSTSVVLNPAQAMHGDLGILDRRDVLLVLSYSGETDELLTFVPMARRIGVRIITLTGMPASTLAGLSDVVVTGAVEREACPFNMAPTASTTATLALGDAIAMVLLEARGFRREDYARLHPGGAIGRTLLLRVAEVMRRGDRLATVPAGATVKDAVLAMTRAKSGSSAIVDGEGRVLGIFTDGDLRRQVATDGDLLKRPVVEVMTRGPVTVSHEALAADVLRVFEQHNIDDVLVVDAQGRLLGAVDIQDLPKFKIL